MTDKPQNTIDYELVIYDELPPASPRGAPIGQGRSILNSQLERIREAPEAWGKPVRIGLYSVGATASGARNTLCQRFGKTADVSGWAFYVRPVPASTEAGAEVLRGLFAVYTPDAVQKRLEPASAS